MGVMLALDPERGQPRQARGRHRGQHERSQEEQACVDAFTAFLRSDSPDTGRCLNRIGTKVLAGRLRPAARALAAAVDAALSDEQPSDQQQPGQNPPGQLQPGQLRPGQRLFGQLPPAPDVPLNFTVSPACLVGRCRSGGSSVCGSVLCEHECHRGRRAAGGEGSGPVA